MKPYGQKRVGYGDDGKWGRATANKEIDMSLSRSQNDAENESNRKWEAEIRADERERCAKAIEADKERVFATGCPSIGELCIYDVCAIIVRSSSEPNGEESPKVPT